MRISIFTATHMPKYLLEMYNSIKDQSYDEWVLFVNGGITAADIPMEITSDSRTLLINDGFEPRQTDGIPNIGSIKKHVCSHCTGDVLVEVDHDDILVASSIDKIRNAFLDPEVVLVYSNTAEFNNDDLSPRFYGNATAETNYDSYCNWSYRDFWYDGVLYKEAVAPEESPFHTSIILFQPNHFRAFRKTTYDEVGGHDETLPTCDDQDLICRFYLKGKFHHINECLYLYRVYGDNSWLDRNADIQTRMLQVRDKYIYDMIVSWGTRNKHLMLDLGGRFNSPPEFTSVDLTYAEVCTDLNGTWGFTESSVGVVRAFDIIEHLPDKVHTMSELHRVLMPGGYALINVPSAEGQGAFQDPTHTSFWVENSFLYYTDRNFAKYIDNMSIRFKAITLFTYFPSQWHTDFRVPYVSTILLCLKDGFRPHGRLDI